MIFLLSLLFTIKVEATPISLLPLKCFYTNRLYQNRLNALKKLKEAELTPKEKRARLLRLIKNDPLLLKRVTIFPELHSLAWVVEHYYEAYQINLDLLDTLRGSVDGQIADAMKGKRFTTPSFDRYFDKKLRQEFPHLIGGPHRIPGKTDTVDLVAARLDIETDEVVEFFLTYRSVGGYEASYKESYEMEHFSEIFEEELGVPLDPILAEAHMDHLLGEDIPF